MGVPLPHADERGARDSPPEEYESLEILTSEIGYKPITHLELIEKTSEKGNEPNNATLKHIIQTAMTQPALS